MNREVRPRRTPLTQGAQVPVLPGCISQGKTREEALANIREAALLCLESREKEGWELTQEWEVDQLELAV